MSPRGRALVTTRHITQQECPWLDADIPVDTLVFEFTGVTYGCVSLSGIAVKLQDSNHWPFYEVPRNAVEEV